MDILQKIRTYVDTDTIIILDGEQITEIDEEGQEVCCLDGETYSFENIEDCYFEDVMFYNIDELEMTYDIRDFVKDLKKSENDLSKIRPKTMLIFEVQERFLLNRADTEECYNFEFFENLGEIKMHRFSQKKV